MLQLPGTCLGTTASDGCQEGCEEGHEEGGEEVSAGAWWLPNRVSRMVFHGIQMNPGCSESVPAKRDVGDTSCIASLESGGLWDHLLVSRLTSSGLAQGCEEDQGAEDEEGARERVSFLLQLCMILSQRIEGVRTCSERPFL